MQKSLLFAINTIVLMTMAYTSLVSCQVKAVAADASAVQPNDATSAEAAKTQLVKNPVFKGEAYLEQWGDPANPSVILVHGLGHNGAKDWQQLAPLLSKNFHVITFDLPGLGRSTRMNELYSPDNYARFVDWVAGKYAQKPFILIGHSMGGNIALDYAALHPNNVKQLILIDAAGILHRTAFTKHIIDDFKPVWWMNLIPSTDQLNQVLGFGIEDYDKFPFAIDMILNTGFGRKQFLGGDPIKISGLAMVHKDYSGLLEKVSMPTLLIWGGADTIAPLRTGKMLAALLPNATLEIIPEAQHVPMTQTPEQLNNIVWNAVTSPPHDKEKEIQQTNDNSEPSKSEICHDKQDGYYSGRYTQLIINGCKHITIENAIIDYLEVNDSTVTIYNSKIGGGEKALYANRSTVFATVTTFSADVPLLAHDSRFDFAGVDIKAKKTVFNSTEKTYVTFSLSTVESPHHLGYVHGVYEISPKNQPF
jgi:pimeloyl-ACP methyl ester carboxylesterase